jgi:taurine dioxygenase
MGIDVRPITGTLGAEVSGVDMANPIETVIEELRKVWLDHKVVVIRDQHITAEEHIAFGRCFGELEIHPFAPSTDGHPEIVRITSNEKFQYAASTWHSDVTWRQEPSMGSILRGVVIPPAGGDTSFADAGAAYDRLPDEVKEKVDDAFAIHDFTHTFGARLSSEERAEKQKEFPPARHPVIRTHPETGVRSIYTNRTFVSHIEGMDADESRRTLDLLERAMMNPSIQCRVKWQVDTFVMWDNRAVQHHASNDFWPETRVVERVTVVGDKPF